MKRILILGLILFLNACHSGIQQEKLLGVWHISDLEYPETLGQGQQETVAQMLEEIKKRDWTFEKNGKLLIQNGTEVREMKWRVTDGNLMKINSGEIEETYTLLETNESTFKMEKRKDKSVVVLKFTKK